MAKSKRTAVSPKIRFEVFKRDKFTCQYCGAKSPDVVLQCDHIEPVAKGGDSGILNLITSCTACNGGKGATPISDDSALSKQRDQLASLEERRQQIEMMLKWKEEVSNQDEALVEALNQKWRSVVAGYQLSTVGRGTVRKLIKAHGFSSVHDAMSEVGDRYPAAGIEKVEPDNVNRMFAQLQSILKYGDDETGRDLAYIIGILKNRCDDRQTVFHADLFSLVRRGLSVEQIRHIAKTSDDWLEFEDRCSGLLARRDAQ